MKYFINPKLLKTQNSTGSTSTSPSFTAASFPCSLSDFFRIYFLNEFYLIPLGNRAFFSISAPHSWSGILSISSQKITKCGLLKETSVPLKDKVFPLIVKENLCSTQARCFFSCCALSSFGLIKYFISKLGVPISTVTDTTFFALSKNNFNN